MSPQANLLLAGVPAGFVALTMAFTYLRFLRVAMLSAYANAILGIVYLHTQAIMLANHAAIFVGVYFVASLAFAFLSLVIWARTPKPVALPAPDFVKSDLECPTGAMDLSELDAELDVTKFAPVPVPALRRHRRSGGPFRFARIARHRRQPAHLAR